MSRNSSRSSDWLAALPAAVEPALAAEQFRRLKAQYSQPWRVYHRLRHLRRMFRVWREAEGELAVEDAQAVALAVWFHDAVYDPQRSDNETESAREAEARLALLGVSAGRQERVCRMILATATHEAEGDPDTALLLDLDLSILGAAPAVYQAYARGIRREYAHVDDHAFRTGRLRVLERFLVRQTIYMTGALAERLEARARRNLEREIELLVAADVSRQRK